MLNNERFDIQYRERRSEKHFAVTVFMIFYILWKMPIVALYMNTYIAMVLLVALAFMVLSTVKNPDIRLSFLLLVVIYSIMELVKYFLVSEMAVFNAVWSLFLDAMPIFVGCILVAEHKDDVIKTVVPVLILSYFITALTTYVGLMTFPEASRLMATGGTHFQTYYKYNIGGFSFIYSLVLLHPLFICVLKARKKLIVSIVFTVVSALCVFKSAYTTAALLFIISCVAYILPSDSDTLKAKRRIRIVAVVLVVALFFVPAILNSLAQWGVLEDSADKITDISSILQGEETTHTDTTARQGKYEKSWATFLANPILGALLFGEGKTGGHSYLLDSMANWGILGLIIIVGLFISFGKLYRRFADRTPAFYYGLLFLAMTIALTYLNPHFWCFELGLAAPMLIYSATKTIKQNQ